MPVLVKSDRSDEVIYLSNAIASLEQLQQMVITLIDDPNGETSKDQAHDSLVLNDNR